MAFGKAVKTAARRLAGLLPHGRYGDYLHSLIFFVYAQRRLPRRGSGLLNDHFFYLRNSAQMADPLRRTTSDKIDAKPVIDRIVGRKVTPETYAVFSDADEIERPALPDRCVLKAAHATGPVIFLDGPDAAITDADRQTLRDLLTRDAYRDHREVNYRDLPKRIICEELLEDRDSIKDYKVFCLNGAPRIWQVDRDRHSEHKQNLYDTEWNPIPVTLNAYPKGPIEPKPGKFDEMTAIATAIAAHFTPSIRVDLYLCQGRIYVGELTHCHQQGNGKYGSLEEERLISKIFFG